MKEAGILLYNLANEKGEKISRLCNQLSINVRWVQPGEYSLPLNKLTNFSGSNLKILNSGVDKDFSKVSLATDNSKDLEKFIGEMFVMVDFSEELLDRFLKEYKIKQIEPVFLKAILTPHNRTWSSSMLNKELIRERLEISRLNNKK
ncbi:MAG: hypothetical protein K0S61_3622 [Anaerocolumna sp.]|jgi:hypothetical protein|nr:hypothetical protein [Anaerocolumna sp.]